MQLLTDCLSAGCHQVIRERSQWVVILVQTFIGGHSQLSISLTTAGRFPAAVCPSYTKTLPTVLKQDTLKVLLVPPLNKGIMLNHKNYGNIVSYEALAKM